LVKNDYITGETVTIDGGLTNANCLGGLRLTDGAKHFTGEVAFDALPLPSSNGE